MLTVLTGLLLAAGGIAWLTGRSAAPFWIASVVLMLGIETVEVVRLILQRRAGIDLLALLTMAGALALGEYLAGTVIALMLASGRALEEHAGRRARRELTALLGRSPRQAHRLTGGGMEEVALDAVGEEDRLLVKPGEVVPVDGLLLSESAVLDESAITGEAAEVTRARGDQLRSGTLNAGAPFELRALRTAQNSTYAGIVRLVAEAQTGKAPFTRLADRYALIFTPVALLVAGGAWALSGDPVRGLAVLVVATPCPLILAAPVAIVAAISRAAKRGILLKNGAALEQLARAEVMLFDKTGTLTSGQARLTEIEAAPGIRPEEVLRLAASLDQVSQHATAQCVVAEARRRGLPLPLPVRVTEQPGAGLRGHVEDREVAVGSLAYVCEASGALDPWAVAAQRKIRLFGLSGVFVALDRRLAGALLLSDEIRLETPRALRRLHRAGIRRTVMLSGDRRDVAETIAAALGIDTVLAECSPEDKVANVRAERRRGVTAMVGDGINDAPALAAADVGIAMGARGAGATSETADAVLLVDRLDRLADGLLISRRGREIALQSVVVGMGLSLGAMGFAAFGFLAPAIGAVLQELIDVTVILNALRAARPARGEERSPGLPPAITRHLREDHDRLLPLIDRIDAVGVSTMGREDLTRAEFEEVARLIREDLLPHERADEETLYPRLEALLHGHDPMGAMSRTHREIFQLARRYEGLVRELGEPPGEADQLELKRLLLSLGAILRLHFSQEEELYQALSDSP